MRENVFSDIEDVEVRETLVQLFETLSAAERMIVILHDLWGVKHREIAEIMDLPIGTVLSKYHRSIRKMRKKAKAEDSSGEADRNE